MLLYGRSLASQVKHQISLFGHQGEIKLPVCDAFMPPESFSLFLVHTFWGCNKQSILRFTSYRYWLNHGSDSLIVAFACQLLIGTQLLTLRKIITQKV